MTGIARVVAAVRRRLLHYGTRRDHVDDLLQDAVVRLLHYQKTNTVRHPAAFLYRTARNLAVDQARYRQVAATDTMEDNALQQIADLQPDPAAITEAKARLQHLKRGLAELSPGIRKVVLFRRIEGFSVREIAELEGLSIAAVEKRIARGTYQLMQWMESWWNPPRKTMRAQKLPSGLRDCNGRTGTPPGPFPVSGSG